jgi:hypothetical protein
LVEVVLEVQVLQEQVQRIQDQFNFSTITSTGGGGGGPSIQGGSPSRVGNQEVLVEVLVEDGIAGGAGNTPPVSPPQGNNGGNSAPVMHQVEEVEAAVE